MSVISKMVAEASDVNTNPQRLAELAGTDFIAVRRAALSNPSTPTLALLEHGFFPNDALWSNPIVDFWFLEDDNPLLWKEAFHLAKCHQTPYKYLVFMWENSRTLDDQFTLALSIVRNINTPLDILKSIHNKFKGTHKHSIICKRGANNPKWLYK